MSVIPSCACTSREYSYTQAMKSVLRDLAFAQEVYYADYETYTSSVPESLIIAESSGVTVTIESATSMGWSATAVHDSIPVVCTLYYGESNPSTGDGNEGEIQCR